MDASSWKGYILKKAFFGLMIFRAGPFVTLTITKDFIQISFPWKKYRFDKSMIKSINFVKSINYPLGISYLPYGGIKLIHSKKDVLDFIVFAPPKFGITEIKSKLKEYGYPFKEIDEEKEQINLREITPKLLLTVIFIMSFIYFFPQIIGYIGPSAPMLFAFIGLIIALSVIYQTFRL